VSSEVSLIFGEKNHAAQRKMEVQMDLIAGMSCSGHLPGKMEKSESSAKIFRRMSAKAKGPEGA